MSTFKKAQVVMLSTNKSKLILNEVQNKLILADVETTNYNPSGRLTKHLYIVNDDEAKEDDYIITTSNARSSILVDLLPEYIYVILNRVKTISTVNNIKSIVTYDNEILPIELNKKVIATTDKSLKLPTVSDAFIAYYIKKYNNQKPITDVLVEYENDILKIHSNNSIFAKNPKDSWSREEIEVLLFKYAEENALTSTKSEIDDFNQWIENNL